MTEINLSSEVNIFRLLKKILKGWKYILLAAIAGGALGYGFSSFMLIPRYTSKISMYVNNTQAEVRSSYIDMADISASRSLVNTYMAFLKSDHILDLVAEEINIPKYTARYLSGCIRCQEVDETEIFNVYVETEDAELSARIGNYIAEIAPEEIIRVFKAGSVEVIDLAKASKGRSYPNVGRYTMVGAFLGALCACGIILLIHVLNQKIKSPEDFEEHYEIPLLGILPDRTKNQKG